MNGSDELDGRPVYVISVAAQLAGMHPQTLRTYDRLGLVRPTRSVGGGRRYSPRDVALLREVARLSQQEGIGLEGVRQILALQADLAQIREQAERLAAELAAARAAAHAELAAALAAQASATRRELVPLRAQPGTSVVLWRQRRRRS